MSLLPTAGHRLRRATPADADAVADVYDASYRLLSFLPTLHTAQERRLFIETQIFATCAVTVAERSGRIASFLARRAEEIRLLYTHPDDIGRGAGGLLMAGAQDEARRAGHELALWCFQQNTRARRFYEARGFVAVAFTDGASNEERTPDMRYVWRP